MPSGTPESSSSARNFSASRAAIQPDPDFTKLIHYFQDFKGKGKKKKEIGEGS